MKKEPFIVSHKDEMTDEEFSGTLMIHRKTIADTINIKAMKSAMMNGQKIVSDEDDLELDMIATIFVIYSDPSGGAEKWFDKESIPSTSLMNYLYKNHKIFEAKFWRSDKRNELDRILRNIEARGERKDTIKHDNSPVSMVGEDLPATKGGYVGEVCVDGDTRKVS